MGNTLTGIFRLFAYDPSIANLEQHIIFQD